MKHINLANSRKRTPSEYQTITFTRHSSNKYLEGQKVNVKERKHIISQKCLILSDIEHESKKILYLKQSHIFGAKMWLHTCM